MNQETNLHANHTTPSYRTNSVSTERGAPLHSQNKTNYGPIINQSPLPPSSSLKITEDSFNSLPKSTKNSHLHLVNNIEKYHSPHPSPHRHNNPPSIQTNNNFINNKTTSSSQDSSYYITLKKQEKQKEDLSTLSSSSSLLYSKISRPKFVEPSDSLYLDEEEPWFKISEIIESKTRPINHMDELIVHTCLSLPLSSHLSQKFPITIGNFFLFLKIKTSTTI